MYRLLVLRSFTSLAGCRIIWKIFSMPSHVQDASNLQVIFKTTSSSRNQICGQSYKASMIVIYDSRFVPDLKIPHITTLDL